MRDGINPQCQTTDDDVTGLNKTGDQTLGHVHAIIGAMTCPDNSNRQAITRLILTAHEEQVRWIRDFEQRWWIRRLIWQQQLHTIILPTRNFVVIVGSCSAATIARASFGPTPGTSRRIDGAAAKTWPRSQNARLACDTFWGPTPGVNAKRIGHRRVNC